MSSVAALAALLFVPMGALAALATIADAGLRIASIWLVLNREARG